MTGPVTAPRYRARMEVAMRYITGPSNERGGKHRGVAGRHLCRGCQAHRARFQYRGQVRADRDHTLCFRCFRAELNRLRALAMRTAARSLRAPQVRAAA
jgi:hypothetical protein